jgi:hypothetical protein
VGSIELIDCIASNLSGAALQLLMGNYARGDGSAPGVINTFRVKNMTATDVAQVWEQPYADHGNAGNSGFYPITIVNKDNKDGGWLDRGVVSEFDGIHVMRSNIAGGVSDGRPPIGCQNTTWLSSRAALFLPVPCDPARLWRFHGSVDVDATNRSACSAAGLGDAGVRLHIACDRPPLSGSH